MGFEGVFFSSTLSFTSNHTCLVTQIIFGKHVDTHSIPSYNHSMPNLHKANHTISQSDYITLQANGQQLSSSKGVCMSSQAETIAWHSSKTLERNRRSKLATAGILTQREAAKRLGVTTGAVSRVICNKRKSNWMRVALARIAGIDYEEFWNVKQPMLTECDIIKLRNVGIEVER